MPGPRRSGIFELRHHIFENLVQEVAKLERIEGKRFIRLLRFAPCKSMHPVLCQNSDSHDIPSAGLRPLGMSQTQTLSC